MLKKEAIEKSMASKSEESRGGIVTKLTRNNRIGSDDGHNNIVNILNKITYTMNIKQSY
jgi:hypothetical protein